MRELSDATIRLTPAVVDAIVDMIRADAVLGAPTSSWGEVAPTAWEAAERVRALVEDGPVKVRTVTPAAIVAALRLFESTFWSTAES